MCADDTFGSLLKEMEMERDRTRASAVSKMDGKLFLQNILGRSLQERVNKYPMNPKYAAQRLNEEKRRIAIDEGKRRKALKEERRRERRERKEKKGGRHRKSSRRLRR